MAEVIMTRYQYSTCKSLSNKVVYRCLFSLAWQLAGAMTSFGDWYTVAVKERHMGSGQRRCSDK